MKSDQNVIWHHATVTRHRRESKNNHRGAIVWFTGLSGAGKSTLAHAVEEKLHQLGCQTFVLDGDNIRHGLSSDLGFSDEDRIENIRRVGEISKLFMEAGIIVLTAFISPFQIERERVRSMFDSCDFMEIFCDSPIEICEKRDVKGLYKKARSGEIKDFTGVTSKYEVPKNPELTVYTGQTPLEECAQAILIKMRSLGIININA